MVRTKALIAMFFGAWLWALLLVPINPDQAALVGRLAYTLPWALVPLLIVAAFTRKRDPHRLGLLSPPFYVVLLIIALLAWEGRQPGALVNIQLLAACLAGYAIWRLREQPA